MGDFNASVERAQTLWPGVLGRHAVGISNTNGRMLPELCAGQGLIIINFLLQQNARFNRHWQHPRSKHWHLLDYVLVCQRHHWDVLCTRVMLSAKCNTQTTSWFRAKSASMLSLHYRKKGHRWRSWHQQAAGKENWIWRKVAGQTSNGGTASLGSTSWESPAVEW